MAQIYQLLDIVEFVVPAFQYIDQVSFHCGFCIQEYFI
jgi:hypothetical protein